MNAGEQHRVRWGTEAGGSQEVGVGKTWSCTPASRGLPELQSGIWTSDRVKTWPFADLPFWAQPKWQDPRSPRLL